MKITEFVDSTEILQYVKFHTELNPALWEGEILKPEVRDKLLEIAKEFYEFLELPGLEIIDIIFTGSNAAFNYTKLSDIDLHLLTDMSKQKCENLAENFFNTKKTLWNKVHQIKINGFDVELYVEDVTNPVNAAGVYSVMMDKWVKHPTPTTPSVDDTSLVAKTNQFVDQIEALIAAEPTKEAVKQMITDLYTLRQSGLEKGGEFSIENMCFKSLRSLGYLQKLRDWAREAADNEMSLEEAVHYTDYGTFSKDIFKKYIARVVGDINHALSVLKKYKNEMSLAAIVKPLILNLEDGLKQINVITDKVMRLNETSAMERDLVFDLSELQRIFGHIKYDLDKRIPAIDKMNRTKLAQEIRNVVATLSVQFNKAIDFVDTRAAQKTGAAPPKKKGIFGFSW